MRNLLALLTMSVGLLGCVGGIEPGDGMPPPTVPPGTEPDIDLSEAKALYDQNVHPIMVAKCSGGACHAEDAVGATLTRFVAKDPANGWQTAVGFRGLVGDFTTTAPILGKVDVVGGHQGMTYTQDEKDKIAAWLSKELEIRNRQPTPPTGGEPAGETLTQAAERVMAAFAGCMTLANFQAANMGPAWANINSNEGQCKRCHANGESMFIANQDNATAFGVISTKKMFWLQYFTVDLKGGAAAAKVVVNPYSFQGVYNRQAPHVGHPTFPHPNNAGMNALNQFYNATVAALGTGCAPKPLENQ